MRKKCVCLLFAALLFPFAAAEITLVSPLEYKASHQEAVSLGSLQAGETLEIILSRDTGRATGEKWMQAILEPQFLPAGWEAADSETQGRNFLIKVFVPVNAPKGEYKFRVKLLSGSPDFANEVFDGIVRVQPGLLKANIANLKRLTTQNVPVNFKLSLINDSVAAHEVAVESTLGLNWFKPVRLSVKPKSTVDYTLSINPVVASRNHFAFAVRSTISGQSIDRFDALLEVRPTIAGKLEAAAYGFPFYTYSLAPFYFLNALLAPYVPASR